MIRELVLVAADMSAAPWFVSRTPPIPAIPDGITVGHAKTKADAELFLTGPITREQAASRFAEGDTCTVAVKAGTGVVAQMWCTEKARYIEWIGCEVKYLSLIHI